MVAGIGCQVLVQLVIMSLQYVAGGAILAALMPNIFTPVTGMLTSAVVFIGITLIGGMWSASQSNVLNVTLQYIGITVLLSSSWAWPAVSTSSLSRLRPLRPWTSSAVSVP